MLLDLMNFDFMLDRVFLLIIDNNFWVELVFLFIVLRREGMLLNFVFNFFVIVDKDLDDFLIKFEVEFNFEIFWLKELLEYIVYFIVNIVNINDVIVRVKDIWLISLGIFLNLIVIKIIMMMIKIENI